MELLAPGELVFDRFRIIEFYSGGGQSFGYKGEDLQVSPMKPWERPVFVKQYHDLIPGTPEAGALARHFQALNARMLASERYLCLPLCVGEANNSVIAVFPLVTGVSLESLMKQGLSLDQRVRFAQAITNAVRLLNKAGIAHLDLKPANVLIEENRKNGKLFVRLIDTDAASIDGEGLRKKVIGTEGYMSPEHFAPGRYGGVSIASDVFTLGILLFELLFNAYPYAEPDYRASAEAEAVEVPATEYHRDVVARILDCLRAFPHKRPTAGLVHSTLHTHYATKLQAASRTNRWTNFYVQISCSEFRRSYFTGTFLGRNNFRGSAARILSSRLLHLRMNEQGASLELVDDTAAVSVGGLLLTPGTEWLLRPAETLTIGGVPFNITVKPVGG